MTATFHHILLVEDDPFLSRAAEAMLRRRGYRVTVARDGEQALTTIRAERPDLVLLDLVMPKIRGMQILRTLKNDPQTSHLPVIVLSNLGQEADIQEAMKAGAAGYLVKSNVALHELMERIQEILLTEG